MAEVASGVPRAAATPRAREPGVWRSARDSLGDFYFNSWRLAPANLAWTAVLVVVLVASAAWLPLALGVVVLGVPLAGISRMAARIVRGEGGSLSDFVDGMRRFAGPALTLAACGAILGVVFAVNIAIGLGMGNPVGWFLAASAAYAEIGLAMLLVAAWPILVDPLRAQLPLRRRLALAALVVIARPGRLLALTAIVIAVLLAGVVILAGIALVGVAYTSLVAARVVLPIADRIEGLQPELPS